MLQENTVFDNRYTLKRLIGRGGFAEVWLAEDTMTGLEEALKIYAPGGGMDEDGVKLFIKELALVHDLRHTHLLTPKSMSQFERQPYLVLPFCPNGSLTKKIGNITEDELRKVIRQVASGLAYLHENGIVHQDIKPDNILQDAKGNYVITDFGISLKAQSTLRKSMRVQAQSGTVSYMAPERFESNLQPHPESDIWSLGAMAYELLEGEVPFNTPIGSMVQKNGVSIPEMHSNVSDDLKQLILQMMALHPEDRPTAAEIGGMENNPMGGTSQKTTRIDSVVSNGAATNEEPVTTPQKNSKKKGLWIGLAVVLVLILGIGVILRMNSGDKVSSPETVTMEDFSINPARTEKEFNDDGSYWETYYDAQGNVIEVAWFDIYGKPCISKDGYAKETKKYDAQGNVIEKSYFGTDGKPCMNKYGYAKITYKYDAQGKKIERVEYDEKGNVVMR